MDGALGRVKLPSMSVITPLVVPTTKHLLQSQFRLYRLLRYP